MENLYYKPSGKVPAFALIGSLVLGIVGSIILAIVYIALQWFIPIVYFNVFITLGFGAGLFYLLNFCFKQWKLRNKGVAIIITLIVAIVGFYAQWALFVSLMYNAEGTMGGDTWVKSSFSLEGFKAFFMHPSFIWEALQGLNEVGTFSLKKSTVSGGMLWAVWGIEMAIILITPIIMAFRGITIYPFSEKDEIWMNKRILPGRLKFVEDKDATANTLANHDFAYVYDHLSDEEEHFSFATAEVYESDTDDHQYLTIYNHQFVEKKGKMEEKKDEVIEFLRINRNSL
ncbi:hypothetical protein [Sphingobacterium detergens]|uniref:Uncharacterized protein n=1 Tax=Sphingobacterium detergens TaxID=1145106 RepID=A0A420AG83_SPHD1|nr:hypothetical protein [Sphingobacterium detergens]RKE43475.1 hypothetical protein DFQ12_5261 [Sphingobacterium detergens]